MQCDQVAVADGCVVSPHQARTAAEKEHIEYGLVVARPIKVIRIQFCRAASTSTASPTCRVGLHGSAIQVIEAHDPLRTVRAVIHAASTMIKAYKGVVFREEKLATP